MTDALYPVKTINGHDFTPSTLLQKPLNDSRPPTDDDAPTQDEADDGQINCVCGYCDDDGYSVACDSCNRWQHMVCYYPVYENRKPPDDMQHFCVDCRPRNDIDVSRAREHQRRRAEDQEQLTNGSKRLPPKSHKKKPKDIPYTNGWPLDKARHDRNSASPRDQPPPAKRPKTSHRTSDSTSNTATKGHSRKRTANSVSHRRSLSRSPETPIDFYSEEFLRSYREDHWTVTNANLHDSIAIANALSGWLSASEEEFFDMHGQAKGEALMRWDGDLEDIPGKAQVVINKTYDERIRDENNEMPMWKNLTVRESVAAGAYIGELKGHVGFKDAYQQDPTSRWPSLRHPEPFVFIHPRLPIYIDARNEGTELRYVRRSCRPNARLQILVTGGTTYHFCFMATEQIDPGMEIAVKWDTTDSVPGLMGRMNLENNNFSQRDLKQLSSWISTVLANCGPCACQYLQSPCMMARFDRRGDMFDLDEDDESTAKPPPSKKKKIGQHVSPLNTNFNSRSGSEARKVEVEDDGSETRSASGSAGRGSASRDITPNTHYSHNGSLSNAPEMSERERKKLAKEEEIFRRQEEEKNGKGGKKKRNSGGSALNTPGAASSSKQLGFGPTSSRYADAGTSRQSGLPATRPGKKSKTASDKQKTPVKTITRIVKRPKPEYVNAEVQCEMDAEEAAQRAQASPPPKRYMSTTQKLMLRCAVNNSLRKKPAVASRADEKMESDFNPAVTMAKQRSTSPIPGTATSSREPPPLPEVGVAKAELSTDDVEMKDADAHAQVDPSAEAEALPWLPTRNMAPPQPTTSTVPLKTPDEPSAPPWSSQEAHSLPTQTTGSAPPTNLDPSQPLEMHIEMPPPPTNPFAHLPPTLSTGNPATTSVGSVSLPAAAATSSLVQSPASLTNPAATILSPATVAAVTPSPAKKKMSLSDYTKRNKTKDRDTDHLSQRDSSPASVASGPALVQASSSAEVKLEEQGTESAVI